MEQMWTIQFSASFGAPHASLSFTLSLAIRIYAAQQQLKAGDSKLGNPIG
jgi:hypothetical protein